MDYKHSGEKRNCFACVHFIDNDNPNLFQCTDDYDNRNDNVREEQHRFSMWIQKKLEKGLTPGCQAFRMREKYKKSRKVFIR